MHAEQTIESAQVEISGWAEHTFDHDEAGIVRHMLEEVTELAFAIGMTHLEVKAAQLEAWERAHKIHQRMVDEEAADVLILLLTLAGYLGFDLSLAIRHKHATNLKRNWDKSTTSGLTHHLI